VKRNLRSTESMRDSSRRWRAARPDLVALIAVLLVLCLPARSDAHGDPVSLSVWGNFRHSAAICQREIGRGAALCALQVWEVRRECLLREMSGENCDEDADDEKIEQARLGAFDTVRPVCSQTDLSFLQFTDLFDVQRDMVNFCRELENAAVSAVFNPYFAVETPDQLDATARACVISFAASATKLFHNSFRTHLSTLNRIADRAMSPAAKRSAVEDSNAKVEAILAHGQATVQRDCSEADFESAFGNPLPDLARLVASRGDCLAAGTYAVDAFTCPADVCGNGMRESREICDDGNLVDGDGCSSSCRRN
jgi:cysteine-rich repeat protein